jgi:hypothetical protein
MRCLLIVLDLVDLEIVSAGEGARHETKKNFYASLWIGLLLFLVTEFPSVLFEMSFSFL